MKILIVDDDQDVVDYLRDLLLDIGFSADSVLIATNGFQAWRLVNHVEIKLDLVIVDYYMPIMDGGNFIKKVKEVNPGAKIILISGDSSLKKEENSLADRFLAKPITIDDFKSALEDIKILPHG